MLSLLLAMQIDIIMTERKANKKVKNTKKEKVSMKRLAAIIMGISICGSLLSGCGGTGAPKETSSKAASEGTTTASENSGDTSEESSGESSGETAGDTSGENKGETGGSGEATSIKLATWDYTSNDSTSNAIAAFEAKYPDIKVEVIDIPSTDYNTKLNVMLNGGSELDAYFIKDAPNTYDLYKKGQMLDLTDRIAKDNVDMTGFNGTDQPFNIEGKQYAMPVRTDYYVLYYNKDLFDAAGVAYPTNDMTWAEFEKTAREVASEDVYGAYIHTWQTQVQNLGIQDGKHDTLDFSTGYDFFKPYYEMAVGMQDDGIIQDFGSLQSANIHYSSAFQAGNVAMMPMGTWYVTTLTAAIKAGDTEVTNWGVATMPHPENVEAGYTVGASTPLVINPTSKKQDAAWKFINFLSSDECAGEYAKVGAVPARLNDSVLTEIASLDGMPEGLAEAFKVKSIAADRPIGENVTEVDSVLTEVHGLIMLGEVSIEEGLAEMAERSEEIQK